MFKLLIESMLAMSLNSKLRNTAMEMSGLWILDFAYFEAGVLTTVMVD